MKNKFDFNFDKKILHPPFVKVQRAKVVILDGKRLFLKRCTDCKIEFYEIESVLRCVNCRSRKRKRA